MHNEVSTKAWGAVFDGTLKLCDLGLSFFVGSRPAAIGGSMNFMAPELLRAHQAGSPMPATAASEVWAIGIIIDVLHRKPRAGEDEATTLFEAHDIVGVLAKIAAWDGSLAPGLAPDYEWLLRVRTRCYRPFCFFPLHNASGIIIQLRLKEHALAGD